MVIKTPTTPCTCCHTALRNTDVRKQTINEKLVGWPNCTVYTVQIIVTFIRFLTIMQVATYFRCGGGLYSKINTGLLPSLPVKKN